MSKRRKNKVNRFDFEMLTQMSGLSGKRVRFLAVAALSAALLGSQIPVTMVAGSSVERKYKSGIELEDLFPDNITVSDPVTLAEIEFPENKYGKLEWMDDSIELTKRVQSCEVLFVPEKDVDLTDMEGWDEELGGVVGEIHVIVSSLEGEESDSTLEEVVEEEEEGQSEEISGEEELDMEAELVESEDIEGELVESEDTESEDVDSEEAETESADKEDTESEEESTDREDTDNTDKDKETDKETDKNTDKNADKNDESSADTEGADQNGNSSEDVKEDEDVEGSFDKEESADQENNVDKEDSSEENGDENTGDSQGEEEGNSNIFDNPADYEQEDERPTELPENLENLTEEEKIQQSIINHNHQGIYVSGINLPWYVQFRVTSGESYEFANESDATIFKSYEFELWDLQNNTEYEIPDGEYISVTIPVKEGYDYTVEHLLDNGASETIIPSVEGGTMIFSTHSFSPFGIAGSKQLVGPDFPIDDQVKPSVTPTPSITGKPGAGGVAGSGTGTGSSGTNNGAGTQGNGTVNGSQEEGSGSVQNGGVSGGVDNGSYGNSGNGNSQSGTNSNNGNSGNSNGSVSGQNNGQSSNISHAVATGDTTAILPFVILIIAAVILIGAVVFIKTTKKK